MNKPIYYVLLGALSMALLIVVFGFTGIGRAVADQAKPLLTLIVNPPDQPVPVSGQVTAQQDLITNEVSLSTEGLPAGESSVANLEQITASTIILTPRLNDRLRVSFSFLNPNSSIFPELPFEVTGTGQSMVITLPQKVNLNRYAATCLNASGDCFIKVNILGN